MNVTLGIDKLPETGEFRVSWIEDGRYNEDKSYYTNYEIDAVGTLLSQVKDEIVRGSKVSISGNKLTSRLVRKYLK